MRWILAFLLVLVVCVGCQRESSPTDEEVAKTVNYWVQTIDGWRKQGVDRNISDEVERLRAQEREWKKFTLQSLGTSEAELTSFVRQGMLPTFKLEWTRLLGFEWNDFLGTEDKPDLLVAKLLELQNVYNISIEDVGRKQSEVDRFLGLNHAKQAQYVLQILYRFPTEAQLDRPYGTPKGYLAHFERELARAGSYAPDKEIYTNGPVTVEHAQELTKIAYTRIMEHMLDLLRQKFWLYPKSSDKVDEFLKLSQDSGIPVAVFNTSLSELEALRLRLPASYSALKEAGLVPR